MWYTPNAQLTYNRIFNFVIGVRGGGKTFNTLLHAIKRFEKTGEEFIYLRRRVIDLEDACYNKKNESGGDLFSDIRNKGYFKHADLKVTKDGTGGFYFYYNERIMGYGKALSTARRSTPLPKVKKILYDEFLIDDTNARDKYLNHGQEMFVFNNFYETISRGRDIPVFFIGNAFSMVNPYFLELGIRIPEIKNNKIYKGKYWTAVFWKDSEFIQEREKTQFYQVTKNTDFSKHAFDNHFFLDKEDFLAKRPQGTEHQFSLEYLNKKYGVWVDWKKGEYYVSTKGANAPRHKTISMSLSDNNPNNVSIRRYRNMPFMRAFRMASENNSVFFDTQETFNMMNEVIYLLKTIT